MLSRAGIQELDHLNLGLVLQKLGGKTILGSRSVQSVSWFGLRILPLVIGVAALTTTLLIGSFLWGYVSRKNKKESEKLSPLEDLFSPATHKPNTAVTLHEFIQPASPPASNTTNYDNNQYFDTLVFDAEQGYAQVLAEARAHAAASQTPPVTNPSITNGSKQSWMTRSSSARRHNPVLEDLEVQLQARFKSKSWKKLLFWKRSKKNDVFELDMNFGTHSNCATPLHHSLKPSRTRASVAPTTSTSASGLNGKPIAKRSSSGPVYNDGSKYIPNRNGRPLSGPLSGSSTPSRDGLYESAYLPLKKSGTGAKVSSGPLYIS